MRLWDVATEESAISLRGHDDWIECVTFSRDGTRVATSGNDDTVRIWESEAEAARQMWR